MWTITDEQLKDISQSMRMEFEKRVFYILSKEDCTKMILDEFVIQNIHHQMDRLIKYNIIDENLAIQFIRFSFIYPILQDSEWDQSLDLDLLSKEKNENEKIRDLSRYLFEY